MSPPGRLLAYAEEHMNAWDCLAGLLLVEEAGGRILQPDEKTVMQDGTKVIAGGAGVFDQVQALCEKIVQSLISTGPRSAKPRPTGSPAAKGASTSGDTTKTSPNSVPTTNSRWLPT